MIHLLNSHSFCSWHSLTTLIVLMHTQVLPVPQFYRLLLPLLVVLPVCVTHPSQAVWHHMNNGPGGGAKGCMQVISHEVGNHATPCQFISSHFDTHFFISS